MKVISFALFKACEDWEFNYYLRGLYWNARMARLIYPDWRVYCYVEGDTWAEHDDYFEWLDKLFTNLEITVIHNPTAPLCEKMLWRMRPLWERGVTHVIARDLDSIIIERETSFINKWTRTLQACCGINDNPAHRGTELMGGLSGFNTVYLPARNFEEFIQGADLTKKGSDQALLSKAYANQPKLMWNGGSPNGKYWESNLIPAFMGSAGINEMEALRFFNRFDPNEEFDHLERTLPEIFYWRL